MDSKNKAIIVVAVVIVLIVAVFAAQNLNKDKNDDKDETATVTFLIQDNYGVYFWIDGEGKTVYDAFADAVEDFAIPFEPSKDKEGNENGITSLFGLATAQDDLGNWTFWQQYTYTDGKWVFNDKYMNEYNAADCEYVAVAYDSSFASADIKGDVTKAAVWDGSTDGTLFTVQSPSGMYFRYNGEGTTVIDAWKNVVSETSIPFTASKDYTTGEDDGVYTIFTLSQTAEAPWSWWNQYVVEDGEWTASMYYMINIKSADCKQMLITYAFEGVDFDPKAPIYA